MPYIETNLRSQYSEELSTLRDLLSPLDVEAKAEAATRLIYLLVESSYPSSPRYYQHNEAVGMLKCCSYEWQRRNNVEGFMVDGDLYTAGSKRRLTPSEKIIRAVGDRVSQLDVENRAGALNYFITVFLKDLFSSEFDLSGQDLPVTVLETVADLWYFQKTAPYEDAKIEENGDV